MEKQFTFEHYNHIKEKTFNPKICKECEEIDAILQRVAIYGEAAPDLYEACKLGLAECEAYIHDEYDGVGYIDKLLAELEPIRKAIAKAEEK